MTKRTRSDKDITTKRPILTFDIDYVAFVFSMPDLISLVFKKLPTRADYRAFALVSRKTALAARISVVRAISAFSVFFVWNSKDCRSIYGFACQMDYRIYTHWCQTLHGKRDGKDICISKDSGGKMLERNWKDGLMHGTEEKMIAEVGYQRYRLMWNSGKKHGIEERFNNDCVGSSLEDQNTIVYCCEWKDGQKHGNEISYFQPGKKKGYCCEWKDGQKHGTESYFNSNHGVEFARYKWENGQKVSEYFLGNKKQ